MNKRYFAIGLLLGIVLGASAMHMLQVKYYNCVDPTYLISTVTVLLRSIDEGDIAGARYYGCNVALYAVMALDKQLESDFVPSSWRNPANNAIDMCMSYFSHMNPNEISRFMCASRDENENAQRKHTLEKLLKRVENKTDRWAGKQAYPNRER